MAVKVIDVSVSNPSLSFLRARTYAKNYTALPNNLLDATLRTELGLVFNALSGRTEGLPADDNTFLVKAQDTYFSRLHSPILGRNAEGNLVVRWGGEDLVLTDSDGYVLKAGQFNFSGRGMDACVFIVVKSGKDVYRLPVSLRLANWEARPTLDELEYMLEDDLEQLVGLLGELPERGASSGSGGEELLSLRDFEVGDELTVVGYKEVKTSYGTNFILEFEDGQKAWSHKAINPVLASSPVINAVTTAKLIMLKKKEFSPGKFSIDAVLLLDLSGQDHVVDF